MKKNYTKMVAFFSSFIIAAMSNLTVEAQEWIGQGNYFKRKENTKDYEDLYSTEKPYQVRSEYWYHTGNSHVGVLPPLPNTSTSLWYIEDSENSEEKEINWVQIMFNYEKLINQMTYGDLCYFNTEVPLWIPFPIYISADRAILQIDEFEQEDFSFNFIDAKIGVPYLLVDGIPKQIKNLQKLDELSAESIAFPLYRKDANGNNQTIGYINGLDAVCMASPKLKAYEEEKTLNKKYE